LGLVHAVEELPRVRAESLDVAPLPLGVERVENERGFPRSRDAGDDDELPRRYLEREVLEVVLAGAADDDRGVVAALQHTAILSARAAGRFNNRRTRRCGSSLPRRPRRRAFSAWPRPAR